MPFVFADTRPTQVKLLYRPLPFAAATMLLLIAALYGAVADKAAPWLLWTWVVTASLLAIARFGLGLSFRRAQPGDGDMPRWLKRYFWTLVPTAAVLGSVPWMILPPGEPAILLLVFLLILGTAVGGASTCAPHKPSAILLITVLFGSLAVHVFVTGSLPVLYGVLIVVLGGILASVSNNIERFLVRSLDLQTEKDAVIARQRDAEVALRQSEEDFRQLAERSIQGILITGADRRPLFCNDECAKIFGYDSKEQFLALPSTELLVAPHERERQNEIREDYFVRGSHPPLRYEMDGLRKDGSGVILECISSPVHWQGQMAAFIAFYDVTEQKQAEERLHQSMKLEAVGQLTGGIAHDFNNLLAVIMGSTELLAMKTDHDDPNIGVILRAANRGAELTQQLLSFSRRQPLMPETLDFQETLSGLSEKFDAATGPDVAIKVKCASELWFALADPQQVETALVSLAANARDAMPAGGTLTISCENRVLEEAFAAANPEVVPGDYVVIAVTDTGSGMPEHVKAQAFEPFFTTKEVGEGSGLGLSMVYGFAKQSGGHVEIDSTVCQGTTVRLYLPRASDVTAQRAANDR